jgi:type I restriction enzyme S subunit
VRKGFINLSPEEFITSETYNIWMTRGIPKEGDVLFTTEAPMGNAGVVHLNELFGLAQRVIDFRMFCQFNPYFLTLQLLSLPFQNILDLTATGLTAKGIKAAKLKRLPIAVPPLAEQQRIVAKVEQLMDLCDDLEANQDKTQKKLIRLNNSIIDQLLTANEQSEFGNILEFIRENFNLLFTTPDTVNKLRSAIVQLAVQGKLIPQESEKNTASALLQEIKSTKAKLVSEKIIRKTDPLQPAKADELPFVLPHGWEVERFAELADIVGGVTKGRNLAGRTTELYPYLRVANVQRGFLELGVMKDIEIPIEELQKFRLYNGDLLITEGGDWDKVGRTAIWSGEIEDCIHQNHVFRARLFTDKLNRQWVMQYLNSSLGRRYFEKASKQTTNLASINMTQLRNCPIPVPPPEEQIRIINRVDLLMTQCDKLEARLNKLQNKADKVANASIQGLLAGSEIS